MAFEFLARAIRHGQDGFTQNDQETDMGRYFPGMIPRKKKWDRSTTLTTQATPGLDKKIAGLGISKGIARVYLRVSTDEQDLQRQERIQEEARQAGYYIAGVYREKASGARADRPELLRMIDDLQYGEVVVVFRRRLHGMSGVHCTRSLQRGVQYRCHFHKSTAHDFKSRLHCIDHPMWVCRSCLGSVSIAASPCKMPQASMACSLWQR